jgi:SAM-dependent methyltransferase
MPSEEGARRSGTLRPGAARGSSEEERTLWADTYESTPYEELPWFDPEASRALVDAVTQGFFPATGAVLDIGCGVGSNVLWLARRGYEAHGIDLSPGAIRAARARAADAGLTADLQVGDALALAFPAARLDAAVDHGCFHTLPIDRRGDYAREVARVLRPGGRYLLCWVAREHTDRMGPPHRPSLQEVTQIFEGAFLFARTQFQPGSEETGPASYAAWLERRSTPQPRAR